MSKNATEIYWWLNEQTLISFDCDSVELSEGYVHKKITGKLLAVSTSGEVNKIYVWNLDIDKLEPIAVLAGLYEVVYELKVLRDKEKVFIIGAGMGKIYVWDLTTDSQQAYIFESAGGISAYSVVRSVNGRLYVLGVTQRNIYLRDFSRQVIRSDVSGRKVTMMLSLLLTLDWVRPMSAMISWDIRLEWLI